MTEALKEKKFILYDYMQVSGGAERVTLVLAERFPEYRVVVSRKYLEANKLMSEFPASIEQLGNRYTKWLTRIPEAILNFRMRSECVATASTVLYSGFYAPLAVKRQASGRRIYYCHTIPRYAYDLYEESRLKYPWLVRWLFDFFVRLVRLQYSNAIACMDDVVVNSENVKRRLNRYLGLNAKVVYPPVFVDEFRWIEDDGYYISVARLTKNKRVEVIVRAFLEMPRRRLVVASGGPELRRLKNLAARAPNIEFTGWQTEQSLRLLIGRAKAAIYLPIDEDFGMSPVECMAAGKPVIGVASGGVLETVVHGLTGLLVQEPPTPQAVQAAVLDLDGLFGSTLRTACEDRARMFDESKFTSAMSEYLCGSSD